MPLDLTDNKSILVQVMVWCRQATNHYLSQCWPRFMSPYGVIRPQWVNSLTLERCGCHFRYVIFKSIFMSEIVNVSSEIALTENTELSSCQRCRHWWNTELSWCQLCHHWWNTELSWCQLCRHWWHCRLSLWQPAVPPVMAKLASWQLMVLSALRRFGCNFKYMVS